uniref:Uncharacterized protein n=1 Tax=Knipowitschia caucasica TaxID=637954 RepID=A0AAV2LSC3_KNICA
MRRIDSPLRYDYRSATDSPLAATPRISYNFLHQLPATNSTGHRYDSRTARRYDATACYNSCPVRFYDSAAPLDSQHTTTTPGTELLIPHTAQTRGFPLPVTPCVTRPLAGGARRRP